VIDGGSVDRTCEIADEFGATILESSWRTLVPIVLASAMATGAVLA